MIALQSGLGAATTDHCGTPCDRDLESALHRERVRDAVAAALRERGDAMMTTELSRVTGVHPVSLGRALRAYPRTFHLDTIGVGNGSTRVLVDFYPGVR